MSYCRFSSDDYSCDVYVYEHVYGGWTTHVAGNRVVGDVPKLPELSEESVERFTAAHRKQMKFLEDAKRERITLPHAGETFSDPGPSECADRLESLRAIGYNVPQYAIDALRQEAKEAA